MIFFRVTQNINIKTTDGTLVNYFKLKQPSNLENETIYITTYDDFKDIQEIFARVDAEKYFAKNLNESNIRTLSSFPKELGITNINEYEKREKSKEIEFFDIKEVDIYKQLKKIDKDEISIALIGGIGESISDMLASCTALRILYEKLSEVYKKVKFDIYINASNNSYYTRDKQIYQTQEYITNVFPLSITTKKLCEYDYFIDNSMNINRVFDELNIVDAWLLKFGINYKKISDDKKFNILNLLDYKAENNLSKKINDAKVKGKLLMFHPYSANINKSIPQNFAVEMLKELIAKYDDYIIVSTLQIDSKIKEENYLDLSKDSKTINDFIYIVSSMDKIITVDTATYHISDAFMIPTVAIFTDINYEKKIKYYKYVKPIFVKDESKNLSQFIYENEALILYKFDSWKKLKLNKIIKLLDSF